MTAANLKNLKCGTEQGTHLSIEEVCYVTDKSFYGLGSVANKQIAAAIAITESGGGWTGAVGDCTIGYSLGLWQIYAKAHKDTIILGGDAFNAYDNAGMAGVVYESGGFKNWSTYKDNSYKANLPAVVAAWPNRKKPAIPGTTAGIVGAAAESPIPGLNTVGQVIQTTTNAVDSTAGALASIGEGIARATGWLGNPHNWLRIAFVGLGGAVVITGLAKLVGVNAGTVASVVPGGKLATAAGARVGTAQANSAKSQYRQSKSAFANYGKD